MRIPTWGLVVFMSGVAFPAAGQQTPGNFELGIAWGRHFGGTFPKGSNDYFDYSVESDTAISRGVRLGYELSSRFSVEVLAESVETNFVQPANGLFGSRPGVNALHLVFVEAGPRWSFLTGRFVPFAGLGVGLAVLELDIPNRPDIRDSNRLGIHLDAGFKAYLLRWAGLRVDVRPRFVYLQSGYWFSHVDADLGFFFSF
jgi:hypothetical protein